MYLYCRIGYEGEELKLHHSKPNSKRFDSSLQKPNLSVCKQKYRHSEFVHIAVDVVYCEKIQRPSNTNPVPMKSFFAPFAITLLFALSFIVSAAAQQTTTSQATSTNPISTIAAKTAGMQKFVGFFTFYWDAKTDKIWLEIEKARLERDFLYAVSLPQGVGSNDIGLDRGQLSAERVVRLERHGPKVLLVEQNLNFRAVTTDSNQQRAVGESFARSVLFGFKVDLEEGSKVLVDGGAFFLRDAHGVSGALRRAGQGTYAINADLSAMFMPRTKSFPQNSEFEVTLTFIGEPTGQFIRDVTPSPQSVTVREHHSFIELPALNEAKSYKMREFDPRSGYFPMSYMDYATPIDQPIMKRFITRHRLEKKNPGAAKSEAVEPIVYYIDNAAPEPIRSALFEGATWWNEAFEAAGFINAFQVKILPDSADPMDVRYNVVQWVHRATRGWSYGGSITDPRTGEILKGHVTLGSLRVRQDFLIASGIIAAYEEGKPVPDALQKMALARLKQLSAHEIGHTIGLAHNFAASTMGAEGRSSVMDYPHPKIDKDAATGKFTLGNAYASGIGEWDKVSIAYGYAEFPTDEKKALKTILDDAHKRGFYFLTDEDARPVGGAHPATHLWDNGKNAIDELTRLMSVRGEILSTFGAHNIPQGQPLSTLDETLVPMYFLHRYQTEAVSKILGGLDYRYAVRGDGQTITAQISGEEQRRALDALLSTLSVDALALPEALLKLIPPPAYGYNKTRESFKSRTGLPFDALAAAEAAATFTTSFMLHPERAARLVEYGARDSRLPSLGETIDKLLAATWKNPSAQSAYKAEVQRTVNMTVLQGLMRLVQDDDASAQSRAITLARLEDLRGWLDGKRKSLKDDATKAAYLLASVQIAEFVKNPKTVSLPKPLPVPPGQPIGCGE